MKTAAFIEWLRANRLRVFTVQDAMLATGKSRSYMWSWLQKMRGIKRIEKGRYCIDGTGIYEIASSIVKPSYISLLAAFEYRRLTTQLPAVIEVVATARHKSLDIYGYRVVFKTLGRRRMFGYQYSNGATVATVEKALLDALYLNYPYEYIAEAFDRALVEHRLDIEKLDGYALRMGSKVLASKLGFMLESHGIDAEELIAHRSRNSVTLYGGAERDRKWGVVHG